jgi:CheY-like chemotaxis protein
MQLHSEEAAPTANKEAGGTASPEPGATRPAVLVVDDEPANLTAVEGILFGLGAEVLTASSGREALRMVLQRDFCAILMDVRMPDMDGYETAATIRQRQRSRRIPIIFLTAYNKDEAQVFRGYSEGAVDYVFKPVDPTVLRAKVHVFTELFRQADEIRQKSAQERRLLEENLKIRNDQMDAERQLRSTAAREAMVFRQLPIAVYETQVEKLGVVRSFLHDHSVRRLLGFTTADLSTESGLWPGRVHPDDRDTVSEALSELAPGDTYSVEYRWRCADDEYRYFLDQGVVTNDDNTESPQVFGTMFDVHSRRTLEQQLLHSQKIDAIGKLTGGIAHDFNNMLTVVIGNLDRIQRTEDLDTRTARRVDHALQGALHCRDITQRLLGFARQEGRPPRVLELNELIQRLSDLVTRTLGERVEIRKKLQPNLWETRSDADQIESALLNLLVNARDAMPDGGSVTIRTANVSLGSDSQIKVSGLRDGDYVALEVADSGIGMTPEVLKRARDAFFTTKISGKGTGLGLSTIQDFARRSGGELDIESSPGKGSIIRIYLPRHRSKAGKAGAAAEGAGKAELPHSRSGEMVLVVEDEEPVRRVAATTLRELGYRVIEATSAKTALDALETAEDVRLLFTDIVMPGPTNGYQLAEAALRRCPQLRVLYTSAYDGDAVAGLADARPGPLLRKPYRDYELAQAVRNAISGT